MHNIIPDTTTLSSASMLPIVGDAIGKGGKDRHVMIPRTLICELKSHIENLRKIHEKDLKAGFGSVKLPQALSDKYQGGSKEFKWQWLFPQKNRWSSG